MRYCFVNESGNRVKPSAPQGKGALTEAFNANDAQIIAMLLQHKSAAQLETEGAKNTAEAEVDDVEENAMDDSAEPPAAPAADAAKEASAAAAAPVSQSYTHKLCFAEGGPALAVREVGQAWFGDVFKADARDDTTGMQLWAAALVMARWLVDLRSEFQNKAVCELGAGCGLPGLAALAYTEVSANIMNGAGRPLKPAPTCSSSYA